MFFLNKNNINDAVEECRDTKNAVLIDVREAEEFRAGHIPGALNVPLSEIDAINIPKDVPVFIYCLRGSRSKKAAGILKKLGYGQVKNIGGIAGYHGALEK